MRRGEKQQMFTKLLNEIKRQIIKLDMRRFSYLSNIGPYDVNDHIVVFQSDDWGSIRTSSAFAYDEICKIDKTNKDHPFIRVDCLESSQDVELLAQVLKKHAITEINIPVFTMNFATANPDFHMIRTHNMIYHNESILATYKKYYGDDLPFRAICEGIKEGVFFPQLHCREHLNYQRWINDLKHDKYVQLAFNHDMTATGATKSKCNVNTYQDSCNYDNEEELDQINTMLCDAYQQFINLFDFESESFAAPCYIWDDNIEDILKKLGVKYIQTALHQQIAHNKGTLNMKKIRHYPFEQKNGMTYIVRNCFFEPLYSEGYNANEHIIKCMNQINYAFKKNKPAVIDTHRANYVGEINPNIQKRCLDGLDHLLSTIIDKYPDVRFLTTKQLISQFETKMNIERNK